jgi:hypothetical protein
MCGYTEERCILYYNTAVILLVLRSIMFKNYTHVFSEFSVPDLTFFTHPLTSEPLSDLSMSSKTLILLLVH